MPALKGGKRGVTVTRRPIVLMNEGDDPIPLPPAHELHGKDLPGGCLHRSVTQEDCGFATPQMLKDLEALKSRPNLCPTDFAKADHSHKAVLVTHEHPDYQRRLGELFESLRATDVKVNALSSQPRMKPSEYARADHTHPPTPLQKHNHPELEDLAVSLKKMMETHAKDMASLKAENKALKQRIVEIEKKEKFTREIAERALENEVPVRETHGHLKGGRLHAVATTKNAGFMGADMVRMLKTLWEKGE